MLTKHQGYLHPIVLGLSLLFFLIKGLNYALIGRFLPLTGIVVFIVIFSIGILIYHKILRVSTVVWAILLIIWATIRILLSGINIWIKPVPEGHVNDQLGIAGFVLSIFVLAAGVILLRSSGKINSGKYKAS